MATIAHKNIPSAQAHEPKGIESAVNKSLYVANGSGSGAWSKIGPQSLLGISTNGTVNQPVVVDGAGNFSLLTSSSFSQRIPLTLCRHSDGSSLTNSPSGTNFAAVVSLGTNMFIRGGTASNSTVTSVGLFETTLPNSYVAGSNLTVTVNAEWENTGTAGATKLVSVAVHSINDNGTTSANLVSTAPAEFSATAADYSFLADGSQLVVGSRIVLQITTQLQEAGGGTIFSRISSVKVS